jgi:hypothetical protein
MDCFPVDEKGEEIMEIKSKPIPEFMKNKTIGIYGFWIFVFFIAFFFLYVIYVKLYHNPITSNSTGSNSSS